jgi:hypothetical protein
MPKKKKMNKVCCILAELNISVWPELRKSLADCVMRMRYIAE